MAILLGTLRDRRDSKGNFRVKPRVGRHTVILSDSSYFPYPDGHVVRYWNTSRAGEGQAEFTSCYKFGPLAVSTEDVRVPIEGVSLSGLNGVVFFDRNSSAVVARTLDNAERVYDVLDSHFGPYNQARMTMNGVGSRGVTASLHDSYIYDQMGEESQRIDGVLILPLRGLTTNVKKILGLSKELLNSSVEEYVRVAQERLDRKALTACVDATEI